MSTANIALSGMLRIEGNVQSIAHRIAGADPQRADSVDLSAEAIALIQAKSNFAALANVERMEQQMSETTLNLLG